MKISTEKILNEDGTIQVRYSSMNQFNTCEELFRLNYLVEGEVEDHEEPDRFYAALGTLVQLIVEKAIEVGIDENTKDEFIKTIDDELKKAKKCIYDKSCEPKSEKLILGTNKYIRELPYYFARTYGKYNIWVAQNTLAKKCREAYKPVLDTLITEFPISDTLCEYDMVRKYKDYTLGGKADFIINYDDNTFDIVDGKWSYNPEKDGKEKYNGDQMIFYAMLYHLETGRTLRHVKYWAYNDNIIYPIDVEPGRVRVIKEKIKRFIDRMKEVIADETVAQSEWSKTKSYWCLYCPISERCEENDN